MVHFTCDLCGKDLGEECRFSLSLDLRKADRNRPLSPDDLQMDHLLEVAEILQNEESNDEDVEQKSLQFDLCLACSQKLLRDPLGKETRQKIRFSDN